MKKTTVFLALLTVVFVFSSSAMINVYWSSDENASQYVVLDNGTTPLPVNSIVQLIYSPDGIIGELNFANPLVPTGGDQLLMTYNNTVSGYWVNVMTNFGSAVGDFVGGYLYSRIFNVQAGDTPTVGDYYVDGAIYGATVESPTINYAYAFSSDEIGGPLVVNTIIAVPEPGTIALAFTAMGFFVIRLLRRKKGE